MARLSCCNKKNCLPSMVHENVIVLFEDMRSYLTLNAFNVRYRDVEVSYLPIFTVEWKLMSVFQLSASSWWQWTLRLQWLSKTSPSCACAFFKSWSSHLLQPARKTRYCLRCWAKHLKICWLKSGTLISLINNFVRKPGLAFPGHSY